MESETILVVDDDVNALELTCNILSGNGYNVLRASSGSDALKLYRQEKQRIDLALIDVVMPRMTGVELVRRLERLARAPRLAFISGYTRQEVTRLIGPGASNYRILWKPLDPAEFLRMIRNVLDTPRESARSAGAS